MLTPKQIEIARQIIESADDDFATLVSIAGLRPNVDFRYGNLDNVLFGAVDLTPFDLTGASIIGAEISQTIGTPISPRSVDLFEEQDAFFDGLRARIRNGAIVDHAAFILTVLIDRFGVVERSRVDDAVKKLTQHERRHLKALGVVFERFSLHLKRVVRDAELLAATLAVSEGWRPPLDRPSKLPTPVPNDRQLAGRGMLAFDTLAVPVKSLAKLDALIRERYVAGRGVIVRDEELVKIAWTLETATLTLRHLGFVRKSAELPLGDTLWMYKPPPPASRPVSGPFDSLGTMLPKAKKSRRRRKKA